VCCPCRIERAFAVASLEARTVDPSRILLMTFSRRAAADMTRRAGRICAQVLGWNAGTMTEALTWAGTFHAIGARLLREYAPQIGVDPGSRFTTARTPPI
jgi:DNA helicase-2/ATP-dependent DNA helicase PcrA